MTRPLIVTGGDDGRGRPAALPEPVVAAPEDVMEVEPESVPVVDVV